MSQRVIFVQGGGTGLDQEQAVRDLFAAAGAAVEFVTLPAGAAAAEQGQPPLGDELLGAIRTAGFALKTKLFPPLGSRLNVTVDFRRQLGLFAAVRPLRNLAGLPARHQNVDVLLVREITEDLYSAIEHEIVPGVVQSIKVVTEVACLRFFRFVFELAVTLGRGSVHCIHKANILKMADGLFLDCFRRAARDFPQVRPLEMIVDNACMQLVRRPQQFDVLAAGNLYGDLLSDLGAGLTGGIAATAGVNHGAGVRVYEAIHGATRAEVPPDQANPLPLLLPALELLRDLGQGDVADRLRAAIERTLLERAALTTDLGGTAGTRAMTAAIAARLG